MPGLQSLQTFEAFARLGSFREAAEELHVTPSAVSHRMKELEQFAGVALFRRSGRRLVLTEVGKSYAASVAQALDELDVATRRLMMSRDLRTLNVSVVPAFLTRWLVPKVRDFQALHPDVELRLSSNMGPIDFDRSDIDTAIYFGTGEWPGLECYLLRRAVLVPVCSPRLVASETPLTRPEALRDFTLINVTARPREWEDYLAFAGVAPNAGRNQLSFSSTSLAIAAAKEDLGIALVDRRLIAREVQAGQLVIPFDRQLHSHQGFYLVHPARRQVSPAMQVFNEWIKRAVIEDDELA